MIFNMSGTIRYTIRPYDTLWMLAQVFNTTVDSMMELNPGIDPRNLQVGQVITIMPGYQYYAPFNGNGPLDDINDDMNMNMGTGADMDMDMDMDMDGMMCDLVSYLRMLWEQHITWTRLAIIAIINELQQRDLILQRLLRNPTDFANAFRIFYGDEAAQGIEDLLTAHLTIAAELVNASKAGDTQTAADAEQRWYENANRIAEYLGSINPNWSTEDWNAMLTEHLDLLQADVMNMLRGEYEESIRLYDDIEAQALEMADMMAEGISKQFPATDMF